MRLGLLHTSPVHVATFADDDADFAAEAELAELAVSYRLVRRSKLVALAAVQALALRQPVSVLAFQHRALSSYVEEVLVKDTLSERERAFIEKRDMFFLATCDADGQPTCSYKGGDPGFVKALDERTLAFPNYDGNGMYLSMGNVLRLPFARLQPWPDALTTVVADAGFTIVALTPGGDVDLYAADLGHKVAVLVGTEGPGLTDDAMAHADVRARIEMARGVDSLNVATAAAVALSWLTARSSS